MYAFAMEEQRQGLGELRMDGSYGNASNDDQNPTPPNPTACKPDFLGSYISTFLHPSETPFASHTFGIPAGSQSTVSRQTPILLIFPVTGNVTIMSRATSAWRWDWQRKIIATGFTLAMVMVSSIL